MYITDYKKDIMIKYSITIIAVMLFNASFAQHGHFGIKGGLNLATLCGESDVYSNKTGFHLGMLYHIHISQHFAIQPELLYSMQGAKVKNSIFKNNLTLNYVNIPILAQYMFDNGFRLETGPQPGILVSAKQNYNGTDLNIKDDLNSFDLSWAFGVGFITHKKWGIDARYNLGITKLPEAGGGDYKNGVFQLGLFYQFEGR